MLPPNVYAATPSGGILLRRVCLKHMEIEKGFYYHYKHDPAKGIFDAAYELLGSAFSTESAGNVHSDNPSDFFADEVGVYRPIFRDSLIEQAGRDFWIRPVRMFFESVEQNGQQVPRFQKITDPAVIAELAKLRDEMYK